MQTKTSNTESPQVCIKKYNKKIIILLNKIVASECPIPISYVLPLIFTPAWLKLRSEQ